MSALQLLSHHFCINCVCGTQMKIKQPSKEYNSSNVWCDKCKKKNPSFTYHCPQKQNKYHSMGYDYCFLCAVQQFKLQSINEYIHQQQINDSNHIYDQLRSRIYNNTYSTQQHANDDKNNYNLLLDKYNKATNTISSLKQNITQNERETNKFKQNNNALRKQNADLHKHISNKESNARQLQQHNLKLRETKDELTAVNASLKQLNVDQKRKYGSFVDKYNTSTSEIFSLKQNIAHTEREINKLRQGKDDFAATNSICRAENARLKQNNNELRKQNADLNEECKELKMELEDVQNKYNKFVQQNSDYTSWDYDTITDWIIGLDKEFIRYEKALRKQLKEEEITGADLTQLDTTDLNRFGIKVFKHKKRVMQEIKKLAMQKQNRNMQNNDDIMAYNEGKKTQYIDK